MLDSGFNKAWGEEHPPFEKPIQSENQTIEVQLAKCGAKSKDIDIASNLNFHFDPCTWNRLFTKENMERRVPMGVHTNPFHLIESMERLKRLARAEKGKLSDSHDMEEFNTYKTAPDYCE